MECFLVSILELQAKAIIVQSNQNKLSLVSQSTGVSYMNCFFAIMLYQGLCVPLGSYYTIPCQFRSIPPSSISIKNKLTSFLRCMYPNYLSLFFSYLRLEIGLVLSLIVLPHLRFVFILATLLSFMLMYCFLVIYVYVLFFNCPTHCSI